MVGDSCTYNQISRINLKNGPNIMPFSVNMRIEQFEIFILKQNI